MTRALALLLVEVDEKRWRKHLRRENGKWTIYTVAKKVIYGNVKAALKTYKKLAGELKKMELTMNPYDPCVWNKDVDGKQLTVMFHIDDLLITHESDKVVTEFIEKLKGIYGQRDPLNVTRGKFHEYLGMSLDFESVERACGITQYDFIKKLHKGLPDELKGCY